jgi:hypothetical protein
MYVNRKIISVESIPCMVGEESTKENSGRVHSSTIYLICCKNFCKCHNVSPLSTTIKTNKKCPLMEKPLQLAYLNLKAHHSSPGTYLLSTYYQHIICDQRHYIIYNQSHYIIYLPPLYLVSTYPQIWQC